MITYLHMLEFGLVIVIDKLSLKQQSQWTQCRAKYRM